MLQRSPNRSIFTIILVTQLCYAFWSWIKSSIILPSHAINHTKKYILAIGRALVIISSLLLPLQIQFVKTRNEIAFIPTMLVIDQSRSMAHNDITPSRRDAALDITNNIYSTEISDTPYNGLSR